MCARTGERGDKERDQDIMGERERSGWWRSLKMTCVNAVGTRNVHESQTTSASRVLSLSGMSPSRVASF